MTNLRTRWTTTFLQLIVAAAASLSCSPEPADEGRESLLVNWLAADASTERYVEKRVWRPEDLTGPWTFGRHPWVREKDGREFIWSHLNETRFPMDIVGSSERSLVLDGFPAPTPDGRPQSVEIRIDGRVIGTAEWTTAERHSVPVPRELLTPGLHEVALRYRYTVDDPQGGPGSERRGMGWRRIELDGVQAAQKPHQAGPTVQAAPSVWRRLIPTASPAGWRLTGVALADETTVTLWVDRGSGSWMEIDRVEAERGDTLRMRNSVPGAPGTVAELGVAVLAGAVDWHQITTRIRSVPERRPVVLVTLDTTRRDAVGCYGEATTPNLDRLAGEGIVWEQAYSPTPATGPAHATIFLSRHPADHGLRNNGQSLPRVGGGNLVVQAKALGYETAAFVSLGTVASDLGFAQAFDTFDDEYDHGWWRFAEQVNRRALPWIEDHPQRSDRPPGFLWVHYSDPHRPYGTADEAGQRIVIDIDGAVVDTIATLGLDMSWTVKLRPGRNVVTLGAPRSFDDDREHWYILRHHTVDTEGFDISLGDGWRTVRKFPRMRERGTLRIDSAHDRPQAATLTLRVEDNPTAVEARRRYAQEVTAMDEALGDLLETLDAFGWLERGLVLVASDHGEDLGENGHFGHIHHVGPTLTHVPLILWGDGLAPERIDGLVGLIDIAPTLWARLGLSASPRWRGVDAMSPPPGRRLFLETFPPEADHHHRGVIELPFRVDGRVDEGREATVAVEITPGRLDPGERARRVDALREAWSSWKVACGPVPPVPPEVEERLRALGYTR